LFGSGKNAIWRQAINFREEGTMRKSAWMMGALLGVSVAALFGWAARGQVAASQSSIQTQPKSSSSSGQKASASPYERVLLRPALLTAKAPATFEARFITTKGDFTITVTREWAPFGADRFYNLVRHHFYDNASFFRAIKGFMVQFGISAYPPVTAAWEHAPIKDDPVVQSNLRGYVSYAKPNEPNTRTTQVFINLVDDKRLDGMGFAPFGQVTDGMDVVDQLYTGYGDGSDMGGKGPVQDSISKLGKPYLDKNFPELDSIKTTRLILPEGAAPAPTKKPAPKAAAPSGS
jgi:peptidyl-prolyl cis-trans isomerase A (cyclophilin A)